MAAIDRRRVLGALGAGLLLAGCAQRGPIPPDEVWLKGYTSSNLRYQPGTDWISDGNYTGYPLIPAGSPIRVAKPAYQTTRVRADIDGMAFRLGQDYSRHVEFFEDWVGKLVDKEDPRLKIAGWPPEVQQAVRAGRIVPGMTREQVVVSLGYPLRTATMSLNNDVWRYWQSSFVQYDVHFDDNRVSRITRVSPGKEPLDVLMPDGMFR